MSKTYPVTLLLLTASTIAMGRVQTYACTNTGTGFRGVANFQQGLVLTATSNAPTGAAGKAEFIAVDDNGMNYTLLFVKTTGLTNGAYSVKVTDNTGTNIYDLGTLNVSPKTSFDDEFGGPCRLDRGHGFPWGTFSNCVPAVGWTNWIFQCAATNHTWTNLFRLGACTNLFCFATNAFSWFTNTLTVGSGSFALPDGLSQSNATVITVSDSQGVVDLTGDFTSVTNSTILFKEIASIIPGTATNAQGSATITYRLVNSKTLGSFKLDASGLPPRQKLFLTANGTNTIKVCTKSNGTLQVSGFRRMNVVTIQDIVATDMSGNIVFTVNF